MNLKALQEHLNKWLLGYVVLAMALGLLIGHPAAGWTKTHQPLVSNLTTVMVFLIVYPMMINLRLEALVNAGRNLKSLSLAVIYNFLWAPVIGWLLAQAFLRDPMLALGFLLVMVVPCSSMSIGYTGLAEGNLELATVTVALSFVLAVIAVPLWMLGFAANYHVGVPLQDMLMSILTVLIAPMVLGYLTRLGLMRWLGEKKFKAIQPFFPSLSLLAMYGIVFLIFFAKATLIIEKWNLVLMLVLPNALFILLTLAVVTWLNRRLGLSYRDHMAIVFASTGKNNGTAIAIATTAFSPLVAIPAATMPIFQILFLALYLKMAGWVRHYFEKKPPVAEISKQPAD
ncbi:bile acid:sodium symporter [uncultured Thermanaerothrix sp.]|uniref:arsenic resistance protein n=1 Tax=uncultured Thermanaerothrix sp. TaxID=1195149 RepID=UPI00260AEF52|nr:bile acid:sodium symporter [uncultured Thermanaerothrix sp.]